MEEKQKLFVPKETVLVIPDTQFPFEHQDMWDFLDAVTQKYSPTKIVHIGDEMDFHAISNYDHDPDGRSPGDEFKEGMERMYRLYEMFPKVKACISNHTDRPYRRAFKYGIPKTFLKEYSELLDAPKGWSWADRWDIDEIRYEHGEGMAGKYAHITAAKANMQSTVMGHLHANAGVGWIASPRFLLFGFAVGCLMDKDAYAAAYGRHLKEKPVLSCGIVDKGLPILVPMRLKRGGRWEGRL